MRELFLSIDTDNSGFITVAELRDALKRWDHKIQAGDVEAVMQSADVDGDGTINYHEFVAATISYAKLEKEELLQKAFQVSGTCSRWWLLPTVGVLALCACVCVGWF